MKRLGPATPVVFLVALVALSLTGALSTPASSARAPVPCPAAWTVVSTPNVGDGDNELVATSATSSSDIWAVGDYRDGSGVAHTLVEHWDGQAWAVVPSPDVEGVNNFLLAVDALSTTDAWAVGYSEDSAFQNPARTLTEHWDGTSWTIVPSPNLGYADDDNYLEGVKAFSSGDVWAVGYYYAGGNNMALHWDGVLWEPTEPPHPPGAGGTFLFAVDGSSSTDAWAVGYYFDGFLNANQPLFAHWDGTSWSSYQFPGIQTTDIAFAVVTESSSNAWAVGTTNDPNDPGSLFSQHWDGTEWSDYDAVPWTEGSVNALFGLAALSPADLWTSGYYVDEGTGATRTVVEHYDGVQYYWTVLATPNVGAGDNTLGGITATTDSQLWTVGSYTDQDTGALRTLAMQDCPIQLGDSGFTPGKAKVTLPRATTTWTMAEGSISHEIVDGTGLNLFDSRLRDPPASYAFGFWAAGTYPVVDEGTGSTMTMQVSPQASPRTGSLTTTFHITWAIQRSHGKRVFDVQILRPGSTQWEDWVVADRHAGAAFVPDSGPGTYSFRARLRDSNGGAATGYSPAASILVS